jgi:hypothetical protein
MSSSSSSFVAMVALSRSLLPIKGKEKKGFVVASKLRALHGQIEKLGNRAADCMCHVIQRFSACSCLATGTSCSYLYSTSDECTEPHLFQVSPAGARGHFQGLGRWVSGITQVPDCF